MSVKKVDYLYEIVGTEFSSTIPDSNKLFTPQSQEKANQVALKEITSENFTSTLKQIHQNPSHLLQLDTSLLDTSEIEAAARAALFEIVVKGKIDKQGMIESRIRDILPKEDFSTHTIEKIDVDETVKGDARRKLVTDWIKKFHFSFNQYKQNLNVSKYDLKNLSIQFFLDEEIAEEVIKEVPNLKTISVIYNMHPLNKAIFRAYLKQDIKNILTGPCDIVFSNEFKSDCFSYASKLSPRFLELSPVPKEFKDEFYNSLEWLLKSITKHPTIALLAGDELKRDRKLHLLLLKNSIAKIMLDPQLQEKYSEELGTLLNIARQVFPKESKNLQPIQLPQCFDFSKEYSHLTEKFEEIEYSYDDFINALTTLNENQFGAIHLFNIREYALWFIKTKTVTQDVAALLISLHKHDNEVISAVLDDVKDFMPLYFADNKIKMCKEFEDDLVKLINHLFETYKTAAIDMPGFPKDILESEYFWTLVNQNLLLAPYAGEKLKKNSDFLMSVFSSLIMDESAELSSSEKRQLLTFLKNGLQDKYPKILNLLMQYKNCRDTMKGNLHKLLKIKPIAIMELNLANDDRAEWSLNQTEKMWEHTKYSRFGYTPMAIMELNKDPEVAKIAYEILAKKIKK